MITKFKIEPWDQNYNVKSVSTIKPPFWTRKSISARHRNLQEMSHRLRGSRAQKEQLKKNARTPYVKKQGLSNARFRKEIYLNCAFDCPCFFTHGVYLCT